MSSLSITSLRDKICAFLESKLLLLSSRSFLHHSSCSSSAFCSADSNSSILSISESTLAKGFPICSMTMTLLSETDLSTAATFSSCIAKSCLLSAGFTTCLLMLERCKKNNFPLVDSTLPKVSKASSLLRMAMAWAMAACSFVRNAVRVSYCFAFSAQIFCNSVKKLSASAFSACAVESFFSADARLLSLPLSCSCLPASVSSMDFRESFCAVIKFS
mmetsp:Transcript_60730/g.117051  ORF Transcript_60730/g.117051 Transcript_60730/m.117051 type:complete len:217 (+) Transcript_60730:793-1443(+)